MDEKAKRLVLERLKKNVPKDAKLCEVGKK